MHLVVAVALGLAGLGPAAWAHQSFAQRGWGPGDVLEAKLRGQGGIDCPCELAPIQLLPGEGLAAGLLVLATGLLGFAAHASERGRRRLFAQVGVTALFGGLLAAALIGQPDFHPQPLTSAGVARGRPAILHFHAEWAPTTSFRRSREVNDTREVARARLAFAPYEADMTRGDEPAVQAMDRRWGILGLPTTIFLDSDGNELAGDRLNHVEPPAQFARRLRCVRAVIDSREAAASAAPGLSP